MYNVYIHRNPVYIQVYIYPIIFHITCRMDSCFPFTNCPTESILYAVLLQKFGCFAFENWSVFKYFQKKIRLHCLGWHHCGLGWLLELNMGT